MTRRTYQELISFDTLEERYRYLALRADVGCPTFGASRWLNQAFYRSPEWRRIRHYVIDRDHSCDLGVRDFPIQHHGRPTIHHLNPITEEDILNRSPALLDLENLVLVSHDTHMAIHYGDEKLLPKLWVERTPGDTRDW